MNRLKGNITEIQEVDGLSLLTIEVCDTPVNSIVISDKTSSSFSINAEVELVFKETEVILSKDISPNISIENKLNCLVKEVKNGKLLSEVTLEFGTFQLRSILSTKALTNLSIKAGDNVLALVKTNEIMISLC